MAKMAPCKIVKHQTKDIYRCTVHSEVFPTLFFAKEHVMVNTPKEEVKRRMVIKKAPAKVVAAVKAPAKVVRKSVAATKAVPARKAPAKRAPAVTVPDKPRRGRPTKAMVAAREAAAAKTAPRTVKRVAKAVTAPVKVSRQAMSNVDLVFRQETHTITDDGQVYKVIRDWEDADELLDAMDKGIARFERITKTTPVQHRNKPVARWLQFGSAQDGTGDKPTKLVIAASRWDADTDKWQFRMEGESGTRVGVDDVIKWRKLPIKKATK
jgi:hypothetical protein